MKTNLEKTLFFFYSDLPFDEILIAIDQTYKESRYYDVICKKNNQKKNLPSILGINKTSLLYLRARPTDSNAWIRIPRWSLNH